MRPIEDLMAGEDAWPLLREELVRGPATVEILTIEPERGQTSLHALQVTTRSRLGALALHTGGLLIDHGWVRVLGGGHPAHQLPSLALANSLGQAPAQRPVSLLVGFDILGGRFEVSGSDPAALGRPGMPGEMCYLAPDTLEWEALGAGHGDWLSWIATGGLTGFYADLRWPGWEAETRVAGTDQGIAVYPFLWSAEARADLAATTRTLVPIEEVLAHNLDSAARLAGIPDGSPAHVEFEDP
jgi:hypothetical protein